MVTIPLLLAALALSAEPAPTAGTPPRPVIVGGWARIAEPGNDESVRTAAGFAASRLKRRHARLATIESAETQVVAGTNYRMVIVLADRTRWRVTVWKRLDGTYGLTASERIR